MRTVGTVFGSSVFVCHNKRAPLVVPGAWTLGPDVTFQSASEKAQFAAGAGAPTRPSPASADVPTCARREAIGPPLHWVSVGGRQAERLKMRTKAHLTGGPRRTLPIRGTSILQRPRGIESAHHSPRMFVRMGFRVPAPEAHRGIGIKCLIGTVSSCG